MDEIHFILVCPIYDNIRQQYIHEHFYKRPNMIKLIELLIAKNSTTTTSLSFFLKHAFKRRSNELSIDYSYTSGILYLFCVTKN